MEVNDSEDTVSIQVQQEIANLPQDDTDDADVEELPESRLPDPWHQVWDVPEIEFPPHARDLWDVSVDLTPPAPCRTEVDQFVTAVHSEAKTYADRIRHLKNNLESKIKAEIDVFKSEHTDVEAVCKQLLQDVDEQLDSFGARPSIKTESSPQWQSPQRESSSQSDDGTKLVSFWKAKHAHVMKACDSLEEELVVIRQRVCDLRALQDSEKFRALRLIGERRTEETTVNELANGYRVLLHEVTSQGQQARVPKETDRERDSSNRDKFSVIDRQVVEMEDDAVKLLQTAADNRVRMAKSLLGCTARRIEALSYRVTDIREKTAGARSASLDKTLEQALDLRAKVSTLTPPDESKPIADMRSENLQREKRLSAEIDDTAKSIAQMEEEMHRELRERRVKVIRSIHSSGGNVDARFDVLRAQQHVAAVGRQISSADSDRMSLRLELARSSGRTHRSLEFLKKTDKLY